MSHPALPPLSGPFLPAQHGERPSQLVILLHGLGADGNDLISLAPYWQDVLPDAAFISPNAPFPCDMAPFGYQWFSLQNRDPKVVLDGVKTAAPILNQFIDTQIENFKLAPSDIALVGFSQGCMMALYTALRRPEPIGAVIGYSGALIGAETLKEEIQSRPPVCLVHGTDDPVVPFSCLADAEAGLKAASLIPEVHERPGLPHGIDEEGIVIARRFLGEHMRPNQAAA